MGLCLAGCHVVAKTQGYHLVCVWGSLVKFEGGGVVLKIMLCPLTQSDLDAATPTVTQVAFRLGRRIHHPISLQYIQRNYHVIQPPSLILAVGYFDETRKHLLGGTGWSVVMAQLLGKPLYVFDVDREQWSWWNPTSQQYQPCEGMTEEQIALPTLQDKTAIVGTREEDQAIYPTLEALFKNN